MPRLVALAGAMTVGKTSVAEAIAELLRVPTLSFGALVRAETEVRGLEPVRETLQDVGQEMATGDPSGMVARLLDGTRSDAIVEGVRHRTVLQALFDLAPDLLFVFLLAEPADLDSRWASRGDLGDRASIESHPVEMEVPQLAHEAAIVLNLSRLGINAAAKAVAGACEPSTGPEA